MKKTLFVLLVLCTLLLTSCSHWMENLSATVTVINETDESYYFVAYYNHNMDEEKVGVRCVEPHSQITFETTEGIYNRFNLKNCNDVFQFYYYDETAWEAGVREEYENTKLNHDLYSALIMFDDYADCIDLTGKQSQNYTIKFSPSESSDNISVEATWK